MIMTYLFVAETLSPYHSIYLCIGKVSDTVLSWTAWVRGSCRATVLSLSAGTSIRDRSVAAGGVASLFSTCGMMLQAAMVS